MAHAHGQSGAVLVADDNPVNTVIARTNLENCGYSVVAAQNGRVALAILEEQVIDLVLLDCRMPIVDGYAVARTVREREAAAGKVRRVPIIAVTGDVSDQNRQDCIAADMDDLLYKPYDPKELLEIVGSWLPAPGLSQGEEPTVADENVGLDQDALSLLRDLDGTGAVLERLIRLFLSDAVQDLISIRHGNPGPAKKAAHNIKSSAANMGALRLATLCQDLETLLDRGEEEHREAAAERIVEAFEEARVLLERELPVRSAATG